jgi:hypothetical protein
MSLLLMFWLSAMTVVPKGVILVKGAAPSASDSTTPLPEQGSVAEGRYRNSYFGLSYPIPAGWSEQPAGPPPSDSGAYVLSEFALKESERPTAWVLISAQDLFFGTPTRIDGDVEELTIADRKFRRVVHVAPRTGLQWRVLSTETRCHALTFTFTGTDAAALDAGEKGLRDLSLSSDAAPSCLRDYADNVVEKTDAHFTQRFNTIPVRLIIDADGRVKHVHVLSAFPEQSEAIITALREWRFKPYVVDGRGVEVETGMVFGMGRK